MSVIDMLELYCTLPVVDLTLERGKIEDLNINLVKWEANKTTPHHTNS